ncbi:putative nucleotide-diphospho-sugar transferase [Shewanella sp. MEBiC00475]|uniref:putative nucleotide-diphospho-sugar transferase n=1 Tax=Shewanella sp. MEBiC00475 TaxID=2575361 RepID=UPI0010C04A58|nr:putative nucleotide-diphospho-sugar transferase [Shewanella sp. MEBiC00475]
MKRVAVYTSFTFSYLAKARVLAETLKRHHPDWDFHALMTDKTPDEVDFDVEHEPFDYVLWSKDINIENFDEWISTHNIIEACTAVKGPALQYLCEQDYDVVMYLDPDVAVFDSLSPLLDYLDESDILLTPHQLTPEDKNDRTAIWDNELCSLTHGVYNLGFVAVNAKGEGYRFAKWWGDRLYQYCREDIPNGMFTDQRWCDLVPAFFDNVKVLRDPGYNVASWNISQRTITIEKDGDILVNGFPLRFFHFTKLGPVGRKMTERYAGGNTEVFELWRWYRERIEANKVNNLPDRYWAYGVI